MFQLSLVLLILIRSFEAFSLESWRCGAPLVEELRRNDPDRLLNDPNGHLNLKESLEVISQSNLSFQKSKLGSLSDEEQKLVAAIGTRFFVPINHRTQLAEARAILEMGSLVSAAKRRGITVNTPGVEERLYSAADCVFTTVAPPFGTEGYGTVIFNLKPRHGFAWGTILTGYTWTLEVLRKSVDTPVTGWMKQRFSRMIFTNNHWDEALALQIIGHVRMNSSIRAKGLAYDPKTILRSLLSSKTNNQFWSKVVTHRLAYFEGHYTDDVSMSNMNYAQFRTLDMSQVLRWGLSYSVPFIQHYNRSR